MAPKRSNKDWDNLEARNAELEAILATRELEDMEDPLAFMTSFPAIDTMLTATVLTPTAPTAPTVPTAPTATVPTVPTLAIVPSSTASPTPDIGSSSRRPVRGENRNTAIGRLPAGNKMRLEFNDLGKPCSDSGTQWARHIGTVIRDRTILPHNTVSWKNLSSSDLDHIWQSISDPFDAVPQNIDNYRAEGMRQAKQIWNRWRYTLNRDYFQKHENDECLIRANPPPKFTHSDWNSLLTDYYFSKDFKKKSENNTKNITHLKYLNHGGSVTYTELERRNTASGQTQDLGKFFLDTHSKKVRTSGDDEGPMRAPTEEVQSRATAFSALQKENPEMSRFELTETVFGTQAHGRVIGIGQGVRPTTFCGDQRTGSSSSSTGSTSSQQQEQILNLKSMNAKLREDVEQLQEQREEDREAMARQIQAQVQAQITDVFGAFASSSNFGAAPPPPPPGNDQ